jgi:hypothetical protein
LRGGRRRVWVCDLWLDVSIDEGEELVLERALVVRLLDFGFGRLQLQHGRRWCRQG